MPQSHWLPLLLLLLTSNMATLTQSTEPDIPDNHKESWLALLAAAEAYSQKSGCDLTILTACKKFQRSLVEGDAARKQQGAGGGTGGGGGGLSAAGRKWDYSYHVWGQGALAEASRRYMDDIAVLHSTSLLTAQRHTRLITGDAAAKPGVDMSPSNMGTRTVSDRGARRSTEVTVNSRTTEVC